MRTGASRYSRPGEWEYVDPKGVIQGPFSSKEVLKWADAGFFTPDQQVETATPPIACLTLFVPAHA